MPALLFQCHTLGVIKSKNDAGTMLSELLQFRKEQTTKQTNSEKYNATILSYRSRNKVPVNFLEIPKSGDYDRFCRNASNTQWIRSLLDLTLEKEGDVEALREISAGYLLHSLATRYPSTLAKSADKFGYTLGGAQRMNVFNTAAMWKEANVPIRARRVIN
jgi:hypothetical protein